MAGKKQKILKDPDEKRHIEILARKLVPLSLPSAREAIRAAEKVLGAVVSTIVHTMTERDVVIPGLGEFRASIGKTGRIVISFKPAERLLNAVAARLKANQP